MSYEWFVLSACLRCLNSGHIVSLRTRCMMVKLSNVHDSHIFYVYGNVTRTLIRFYSVEQFLISTKLLNYFIKFIIIKKKMYWIITIHFNKWIVISLKYGLDNILYQFVWIQDNFCVKTVVYMAHIYNSSYIRRILIFYVVQPLPAKFCYFTFCACFSIVEIG